MSEAISTPTAIVLEHKGYQANVERMLKDNSLQGLVVGMKRDLLSFEGADITELAANFQEVIEDYLADCAEDGVTPEVPRVVVPA
ncbi:MAG: hypothetical protein AAFQ95_19515 [Cyanobacteria bacterium J06621_3]